MANKGAFVKGHKASTPPNFKDLTGKRFGKLTVIKRVYPNGNDWKVKWLCKCDCGNETILPRNNLLNAHTRSCGCLKTLPPGVAAMNNLITSYKYEAKKRGYKWELTKEQFKEITQKNCFYCGIEPNQSCLNRHTHLNGDYIYNGIDRIDNTKGYTIDNVVPCCGVCNMAKGKQTQKEFRNWIERTYKYEWLYNKKL